MDLDDSKLKICIEPSSNILSHEQTPVAGTLSVPQDESRGLNELSSEDLNCLKKQVYEYAVKDRWKEAETIFNKYDDMVRIPLNDKGDRALHVAVKENSITFVKGLVNQMTPQDLQILNSNGYNAFCMAAESGNGGFIQIMIENNENLPLIHNRTKIDEWLPVHWAVGRGHHKIVQDLSSKTLLQKMDFKDIEKLFFKSIAHDMFDVAMEIFEEYPAHLAISNNYYDELTDRYYYNLIHSHMLSKPSEKDVAMEIFDEYPAHLAISEIYGRKGSSALYTLASKPLQKGSYNRGASWGDGLQLLKKVWHQVRRQLKPEVILRLMSGALFEALKSGNVEAVEWLLSVESHPEQNILHYLVRHRHSSTISCIFKMEAAEHMLRQLDENGNNILHLAAYPLEKEETSTLRATTKITRDIAWFKEIKNKVPPQLRTMRNYDGMTPKDMFIDEHKQLSKEVKDTAKGIADSGMLVAALVATVAFAAALVVPGDKTNPWFIVFILANAAALFTSSASILSFLSNFTTSRFADSEFVIALHPSLILGPMLLLISIVTMVISFAAASFLIFEHTSKWVAYVVTSMGVFPILLFFLFQFSIFDTFIWSRFYRMS